MDLNLAQTFARVVETRSMTAAARALGLPKSSVSRAVARLEEELGAPLLERTTRTLNLTAAGRAYYEHALRALEAITEAERAVAELQGEPRGLVRVTAPIDLDESFLSQAITDFVDQHPAIQVEISFSNRVVDLVAEKFDLALRAGRLADSSLVARLLSSSPAWLLASPAYLKAHGRPRRLRDLETHRTIEFFPIRGRGPIALTGPRGIEHVELHGSIATDDFSFVHRLLLAGAGIGLCPALRVRNDVKAGTLQRVLPDYQLEGAGLSVVVPSARHLPRRVALLRDHLIAAFAESDTF